jgi:hypothetical protein
MHDISAAWLLDTHPEHFFASQTDRVTSAAQVSVTKMPVIFPCRWREGHLVSVIISGYSPSISFDEVHTRGLTGIHGYCLTPTSRALV